MSVRSLAGSETLRVLFTNKLGLIGLSILALFTLVTLLAPWIAPYDPYETDLSNALKPPSREHPLGTDEQGRDILSRIMYGARLTLGMAIGATMLGALIGVPLGLVSGYYGGRIDFILQRITDILLALPGFLLALAFAAVLGPGAFNVVISVGVYFVPIYIRIARASTLQVREMEYVRAAEQLGLSKARILFKHILPNVASPIIVQTTLNLGVAVLFASGLGFLGLGVPPPHPEWGTMLGTGRAYIFYAPHVIYFPGLAILLTVLAFNFIGDALREALDPRLRGV